MAMRSISILLVLLLLSGCSRYKSPKVIITDARFVEETDEAIKLEFDVDLENPNDIEMPLRYFDYHASLTGGAHYKGKREAEATIPARGQKRLTIPAVFLAKDLNAVAADAAQDAPIRYTIHGHLHYETPGVLAEILLDTKLRRPKVGFSARGWLQLSPLEVPASDDGQANAR
jgi:LEA14-like dessication related protein